MVYCISSTVETLTAGFPVGALEITMISLYSALGVPLVIAGAATALTRLLTFRFQIIVCYPIFQLKGLKEALEGGLSDALLEAKNSNAEYFEETIQKTQLKRKFPCSF